MAYVSCRECNAAFNEGFEKTFNNALKPLLFRLRIRNRYGVIPSIKAKFKFDSREFDVILHPDESFQIIEDAEDIFDTTGKKTGRKYWTFTTSSLERVKEAVRRKGQKLSVHTPPEGQPIEFRPESVMPLNFLLGPEAKRSAAKVAFMILAAKAGARFAASPAFEHVRQYIRYGMGDEARLFFNEAHTKRRMVGAIHHSVAIYCNGRDHTVYAIVMFFGGLFYLVKLSDSYCGADYGCEYAFDALAREEVPLLVSSLENERLALENILRGQSRFDDLESAAQHWITFVERSILLNKDRFVRAVKENA